MAAIAAAPVPRSPALVTVAIHPARLLSRLWARPRDGREPILRSAIFVSATLSAPSLRPDFSGFMQETGINPAWTNYASARSRVLPEPLRFGALSFMLADRNVPVPTLLTHDADADDGGVDPAHSNARWLDYAAAGVRAARERGGRVLVLATSYGDAEALVRRVTGAILHRRGQKLDLALDAFRADPAAVLVTPAAWGGVSLPGLVAHLVIPRIPFPVRDEARDAVMVRAMTERGLTDGQARGVLHAQARIDAKRKLRQGIGRAIRRASDQAVLWLLDPRFPLPDSLVRNPRFRLHQGAASRNRDLIQCIPTRFRTGARPAFDRAEVFAADVVA